jgi:transposase InsO family protein
VECLDGRAKLVLGTNAWKLGVRTYDQLYHILHGLHCGDADNDHNGVKFMIRHFQDNHYVPGIRDLLREYVASCNGCQLVGNSVGNSKRVVQKPIKTTRPLSHMQLDVSKHPQDTNTGAMYTIAMKCLFSGYTWAKELLSKDAEAIAIWLLDVFTQEGVCTPPDGFVSLDVKCKDRVKVHTDNGKEFVNKALRLAVEMYQGKHVRGKPWQPWVQGGIERLHRELKKHLSNHVEGYREGARCKWVAALQESTYRCNQQPNDGRLGGMTPFFCLRGFNPKRHAATDEAAATPAADATKERAEMRSKIQVSYSPNHGYVRMHL